MTAESTKTVRAESYVENLIKGRWPKLVIPAMQEKVLAARVLKMETLEERRKTYLKTHTILPINGDAAIAKIEVSEYQPKLCLFDRFIHLNAVDKALVCVILAQRTGGTKAPRIEVRSSEDADITKHGVEALFNELYGKHSALFDLVDVYFS